MIVVEGCDKTGKSSVCDMIVAATGRELFHFGVPTKRPYDFHVDGLKYSNGRAVVDRLHWSEYAYGIAFRGGCGYSKDEWAEMERFLVSRGTLVVLMHDKVEEIESRWEGEPWPADKISEICGHFSDLAYRTSSYMSVVERIPYRLQDFTSGNALRQVLMMAARLEAGMGIR